MKRHVIDGPPKRCDGGVVLKQLFLQAFARFAAGDHDVLYEILHEDFVEHGPGNPSGRDAFVAFIKSAPVASAGLELKHVIADDAYVVAHYVMSPPDQKVVDIWRFDGDRIAEHWDVVQQIDGSTENDARNLRQEARLDNG
jgi:predicted SnoaL-like aldol condensation-catalyzing enzyme